MEPIKIVAHDHVERCCGRPLLLEAADMKIGMVGSPVGQPVNEVRIAMESKDDRLVSSEQAVEVIVTEAVWVIASWLKRHEVDDVHHPDLQFGNVLTKEVDGRKRLERRHVAGASHDDIRLAAVAIGSRPVPDANPRSAMRPFLEQPAVGVILPRLGDRHLMRPPEAFDPLAVNVLRTSPALGTAQHDHGPTDRARSLPGARGVLNFLNPVEDAVQRRCHLPVHVHRIGASPLVPTDTPPPFSSRLSRCSHLDCRAALTINADHSVGACQAELKLVQKAMLDIPILLREVLTLRTIEELSQAETAAILGVSEKTVETRLYRARARLKKVLDETEA